MTIKFISILFFILFFTFSCSADKADKNANKVEIVLSDENDKESVEIRKYDERELKIMALDALKEFLSLPYNAESVWIAYEKFYSSDYKETLGRTRNVKNADDYVKSEPSLDFEFETTIDKVYSVSLEGKKAYMEVDSSVYDRVNNSVSKARQTFVMEYEDDKWVISR